MAPPSYTRSWPIHSRPDKLGRPQSQNGSPSRRTCSPICSTTLVNVRPPSRPSYSTSMRRFRLDAAGYLYRLASERIRPNFGAKGNFLTRSGLNFLTRSGLDVGDWKNTPIAFMFSDFTFLTKAGRVVPHNRLQQLGHTVYELNIRFRFDKNPRNFTIRKFRRSGHHFLCPILGGISVISRAIALRVPPNEPIGVYRTSNKGTYTLLRSYNVITRMQAVCRLAHPDKDSFFYKNAAVMVSHSIASRQQLHYKMQASLLMPSHFSSMVTQVIQALPSGLLSRSGRTHSASCQRGSIDLMLTLLA